MGNKANAPNWKKIKAEYIRGGISQQKLADKYGVAYGTLKRRALLENWSASRSESEQKASFVQKLRQEPFKNWSKKQPMKMPPMPYASTA